MKPNKLASKRTKERFKAHSPLAFVVEGRCNAFGDKMCVLLESKTWLGWVPKNEVDFDK